MLLLLQEAVWKSDPVLAAKLAPPVQVESYSIRPPKGYTMLKRPGPDGSVAYAWAGAPREDGTRSMLMLILLTPPKEEHASTAEAVVRKMAGGIHLRPDSAKQDAVQHGTMGGLPFARLAWKGIHAEVGQPIQGVHYAAQDGSKFVVLWTQDVTPEGEASLRLTEASIRSFRR